MNLSKTREELIERLKRIANDKSVYYRPVSAMCYSPALPQYKYVEGKCDRCGATIMIEEWDIGKKNEFKRLVSELQEWGYDAKYANLCLKCTHEEGLISDEEYEQQFDASKKWQEYLEEDKKNPPQYDPDSIHDLPF